MGQERVFQMPLSRVYPLLAAKAERKGRGREEVDAVIQWLTGDAPAELHRLLETGISYGDFFRNAPRMHPDRQQIRGSVCGVRVEEIQDPLLRDMRYLDKLIDELARGKSLEAVLRRTTPAP